VLQSEFDVYFALNGNEALQKVESLQPDLILLDIMMPVMDGFEVCRNLKSKDQFKNIPIIFITALGQQEEESRGFRLGAVDYITKPFNPDLVLLRVRNHLELKKRLLAVLRG
jgi:DNA-binding response OmpR family regulator